LLLVFTKRVYMRDIRGARNRATIRSANTGMLILTWKRRMISVDATYVYNIYNSSGVVAFAVRRETKKNKEYKQTTDFIQLCIYKVRLPRGVLTRGVAQA